MLLSLILLIAGIGFIIGLQLYGLTEDFDQIEKHLPKALKDSSNTSLDM